LFSEELIRVDENAGSLRSALEEDISDTAVIRSAFNDLIPDLNAVTTQTDNVREAGRTLANQLAQVPLMFPDDPVDYHLLFVSLFVVGPRETEAPRGILGAAALAVDSVRQSMQGDLLDSGSSAFDSAVGHMELTAWTSAAADFDTAATLFGLSEDLVLVSSGFGQDEERERVLGALEGNPVRLMDYEISWINATASDFMASLAGEQALLEQTDRSPGETLATLGAYRSELAARSSAIRDLANSWSDVAGTSRIPADDDVDPLVRDTRQTVGFVTNEMESATRQITDLEIAAVDDVAELALRQFLERYRNQANRIREAEDLLSGVAQNQEAAADDETVQVVYYYFPDDARELIDQVIPQAEALQSDIGARDEALTEERRAISASTAVVSRRNELSALSEDIESLIARARELEEAATSRILRAQQLAEDAGEAIAEAQAAVAADRLEIARRNLDDAKELYFESLQLREDPELREESYALVRMVGERIQEAQQQIVIREVRELLIRATQLYTREEYVQAQTILNQAQTRWETTMPEENPEITRIRLLVNAALQRLGGREITELDPLYRVLTQYLNLAQSDYQEGRKLYDAGRDERGDQLFDRANENIQNVLSVRPLNWEGQVLRLRILQIRESDNFDTIFANRYQDAVAQIRAGSADLNRVLTELEALYEIDPDYPGLAGTIREVEIDLGLRPDPVTQARIARSNDLLNQARNLSDSTDRFERERAVSVLDEAIQLNPTNVDAQLLKDEILISLGAQASVALSPDDEQLYRRAESLFVEGRLGTAYDIVVRLLNDETNQRYPPLLDLRRRIESRLGI
jgi:hypothetical protein